MDIVEYAYKMKDMASGPLGKIAGAFSKTDDAARKAQKSASLFAKVSAGAFGVLNIVGAVKGAIGAVKEFTAANDAQAEAEAKLAQVMRNTMDASDDEIKSIKDLTAAQQKLGIVGDEVQLAGAQELGTYLEKAESLKKLIPVMNDMVAQQYGYNATQESAVNIATMMGKVMEGQVGALSRYGYKFDEAQEKILKYGTEAEKVATLAEVIGESVGGMNEALAQTPEGRMKQLSNALGDIKERIGTEFTKIGVALLPAVNKVMPYVEKVLDLTSRGIDAIISKVASISGYIAPLMRPILDIFNKVKSNLSGFADYLRPVQNLLEEHILPVFQKVWNTVSGMVGEFIDFVANSVLLKDIFNFVGKIAGALYDVIGKLIDGLKWTWNKVIMPILNGIEKVYRWIKGTDLKGGSSKAITDTPSSKKDEEQKTTNAKLAEIAKNTRTNDMSAAVYGKAAASSGPKIVNINVQKFFDNINFNTTSLQESTAKIEEAILEVLSRVLVQGASVA